jgi:hypothetical protein
MEVRDGYRLAWTRRFEDLCRKSDEARRYTVGHAFGIAFGVLSSLVMLISLEANCKNKGPSFTSRS